MSDRLRKNDEQTRLHDVISWGHRNSTED